MFCFWWCLVVFGVWGVWFWFSPWGVWWCFVRLVLLILFCLGPVGFLFSCFSLFSDFFLGVFVLFLCLFFVCFLFWGRCLWLLWAVSECWYVRICVLSIQGFFFAKTRRPLLNWWQFLQLSACKFWEDLWFRDSLWKTNLGSRKCFRFLLTFRDISSGWPQVFRIPGPASTWAVIQSFSKNPSRRVFGLSQGRKKKPGMLT